MAHKKFQAVEQPILVWKKLSPDDATITPVSSCDPCSMDYGLTCFLHSQAIWLSLSLSCVYYYLSGPSSHLFSLAEVFIRCCFLPFLLSFVVYLVLFMLLLADFHMLSTSLFILYACLLGCPVNPFPKLRNATHP